MIRRFRVLGIGERCLRCYGNALRVFARHAKGETDFLHLALHGPPRRAPHEIRALVPIVALRASVERGREHGEHGIQAVRAVTIEPADDVSCAMLEEHERELEALGD